MKIVKTGETNKSKELMTVESLYTLRYFSIVEILMGLWLLFPYFVFANIITIAEKYLSLNIFSIILISGGVINLLFPKHFKLYILFVSIPFMLLGVIFFQVGLLTNNLSPGTILLFSMGIYSSIHAGIVFNRRGHWFPWPGDKK